MITEAKKKTLEAFAEGRKLYKLMKFPEALAAFERALAVDPNDGPSKEYKKRCLDLIANPPPEDWDGVYVMTTK
ncbi:MAG TPA: tetratricopeptide repeat protein [Spirochaetia bacterium]|nr:tetratricopeptide repeat protein [Spirochaetia bacterium]